MKTPPKNSPARLVIRRLILPQWQNIQAAADLLGVSHTQVRRHVSGQNPSRRLARRMEELGIVVETEPHHEPQEVPSA